MLDVLRVFVALHDDSQALSAVGPSNAAEHDVSELLLRSQHVEARLGYDLREQFQKHVVLRRLQSALVINLRARALVRLVLDFEHEMGSCKITDCIFT